MAERNSGDRRGGIRSLEVVLEVVRRERDAQLRHWDALDAKGGVMLGFAAALAALAPMDVNVVVDAGRILAVAGGLAALVAFWPRRYTAVKVRKLRDRDTWRRSRSLLGCTSWTQKSRSRRRSP